MATIDQQFVEYIVKTLVNNPDKVKVDRSVDEKGVLLNLEVDPEDVGRIIGRRGATAQSIRTLLRALGTKNDARYNLKIANNDGYVPKPRDEKFERPAADDSFAEESEPVVEESEPAVEAEAETEEESEDDVDNSKALAEKTNAELADLDDLDI
ncbi:KH domain-containing protein [Candidatus Saccharibacteria bacterium]|nr:KH domain-containing protein [Candidatus Saccharibacteria bacterium]